MSTPLPERMRPTHLDEIVGHRRWIGEGRPLRVAVDTGNLGSLVLHGPPGCGKTTLARVLASATGAVFLQLSAVLDGVKQLRGVIERADIARRMEERATVLFVDEIHRWNKAQQDALLPHVESGALTLIGATTENPAFELNRALRSRVQLIRLEPVPSEAIEAVLRRALTAERGLDSRGPLLADDAVQALAQAADGDVRQALSDLERLAAAVPQGTPVHAAELKRLLPARPLAHDKSGDAHHNVMSALIKSMRGSDPDAALYWLARLIQGGESPTTITRRLMVFASEDVGNADPRGLQVAVAAAQAVERIGWPEGRIVLGQCVTWLATSPKSNASYLAIDRAIADVDRLGALPVPEHIQNRPDGYLNPHDHPDHIVPQDYLPERLRGRRYYEPAGHAEEKRIAERLAWWRRRLAARDE